MILMTNRKYGFLDALFFKEDQVVTQSIDEQVWHRTRLYMYSTAALVLIWGVFDYFIDLKNLKVFLILRFVYTPVTLLVALNFHKPLFRAHHKIVAKAHYLVLIVDIGIMTLWTDHFLKYLIGFSTIFWGASVLMLWRFWYTIVPGILAIAVAIVRFKYFEHNVDFGELVTGSYYFCTCLTFTGIISGFGYWAAYRLAEQTISLASTQQKLIQAEKTQSLNLIVASVAHEINTPIGIAVSAVSDAEDKLDQLLGNLKLGEVTLDQLEDPARDAQTSLVSAMDGLTRTANLVSRFKQTAVDQSSEQPRVFELCDYIQNNIIAVGLKPLLKKSEVSVSIRASEEIILESYPGAISQIITNLVMNSINHGFRDMKSGLIDIELNLKNSRVCIIFADNGCGILPEHINLIFNPFFTTSNLGQPGDGLGLSIVFGLVSELLRGDISVASSPGMGTQFFIEFPLNQLDNGVV